MKKKEVSRHSVRMLPSNNLCDLVTYEVENYGPADFVENIQVGNGQFRRERSLMPFQYLDRRADSFKWELYGQQVGEIKGITNAFVFNFHMWRKEGKGLYIFSGTKGSGKTLLACCLANELMERLDICVKFVSIPELLEMTKDSYKDYSKREDLDGIRMAELLIIDDIGVEMKKEWVDSVLFRLIDWRYTGKRVTIFTSNIDIDSLKLDDRIIDRIFDMCIPLHLPEVSVRRKLAEEKNNFFTRDAMKENALTRVDALMGASNQ